MCLHGRLLAVEAGCACLADAVGQVNLFLPIELEPRPAAGAWVEVTGRIRGGRIAATRVQEFARAAAGWQAAGAWGGPTARCGASIPTLRLRAQALAAVRAFFSERGFLEVETPFLVNAPGQEAHLEPFRSAYNAGRQRRAAFLITSPEHHMKRLLSAGHERIYQLARCFRDEEASPTHNPEFTMIEWYRAWASYEEVMADTEALVAQVARAVRGTDRLQYRGRQLAVGGAWTRWTVRRAFAELAGLDLSETDAARLRRRARDQGHASVTDQDSWDDVFYKVLLDCVEPALAAQGCAWLLDYPARHAALAKLRADDPDVAERAEAYVGGMELANGFTELNDPVEQRRRFGVEAERRRLAGAGAVPLDRGFLQALDWGMPPAGGMALGFDRLVMILADAAHIGQVLAFPDEPSTPATESVS